MTLEQAQAMLPIDPAKLTGWKDGKEYRIVITGDGARLEAVNGC